MSEPLPGAASDNTHMHTLANSWRCTHTDTKANHQCTHTHTHKPGDACPHIVSHKWDTPCTLCAFVFISDEFMAKCSLNPTHSSDVLLCARVALTCSNLLFIKDRYYCLLLCVLSGFVHSKDMQDRPPALLMTHNYLQWHRHLIYILPLICSLCCYSWLGDVWIYVTCTRVVKDCT